MLVLSLAAIVTLLAPSAHAADQLSVAVDEPFEIDGETFDPATVTLRHVQGFNPTAEFHEVWIDGKCLGVMIARSDASTDRAADNAMVFTRNADDRLVLVGMTLRGERAMSLHRVGATLARTAAYGDAGTLVATTK